MLIVCPNCATSYQVIPDYLGESGRPVRCVDCHHVWFEEPHRLEPEGNVDDASPPLQPCSQGFGPSIDAGNADSAYYSQADHDAAEYDSAWSDDTDPRLTEPEIRELASAPSISAAGPENRHAEIEVETYVERLADHRSFRRPIPARRRRPVGARAAIPALICVLVLALAALVAAHRQVVRHLPQTASLYRALGMPVNLRGLQFDNIRTVSELQDGVPVLVVEGEIVGTRARLTEVPRLRIAVTDRTGNEIYVWTARPGRTLLPPGETLPFRSRLASPPAEASGVTVRFFDGHDATAGLM